MHAIEVAETGGPEVLRYVEKPTPSPGPAEVLIAADAIGVNFIERNCIYVTVIVGNLGLSARWRV